MIKKNLIRQYTLTVLITALLICFGCAPKKDYKKISVKEYNEKVYASWLGQCIGNIYGLPHENAYIDSAGKESFPYGYGKNAGLLRERHGAFSDDDTDIEYMYLLAMEKYGIEPKLSELSEMWKYHVRDQIWLANRAALAAMHFGYTPPITGLKSLNPHWFQIDPQLINEIWAVTSPGMIKYAAAKSRWAASIMDDDWGVEPTIFYGALYSAAFFESDINTLLDIGVNALPENSRFAKTVAEVRELHKKYPDNWRKARSEMSDKYWHNEPADTKTIWNANLNGACGVLAFLYGEGDFQKTLDLACAVGFDADNQAATLAGLIGIMHGREGLPEKLLFPFDDLDWKLPLNDSYKNVTRFDMPDAQLTDMAQRMAALGEEIILRDGGQKITEGGEEYYLINSEAQFVSPLEMPESPLPVIELNNDINYEFPVVGGSGNYKWEIVNGNLPEGLTFTNGKLTGKTGETGLFPVTIKVTDTEDNKSFEHQVDLIARGRNIAQDAVEVLSNVKTTDTKVRNSLWLTVPHSLYADTLENIIRDGKYYGEGSTFYSITNDPEKKIDYYGYQWEAPVEVGVISLHTGSVEEMGGWFNSLDVEYMNEQGKWEKVNRGKIIPGLPEDVNTFIRPNFVEYILTFQPVTTKAIRIIGTAGGLEHWHENIIYHFSSITELSVYKEIQGL